VHLHHLKRKLGEGWIHNIRGVGYKLARSATDGSPADTAPPDGTA
jgi:hypothetical protein